MIPPTTMETVLLVSAAAHGEREKIHAALIGGSDIHYSDDLPLWSALINGHEDLAYELVRMGAGLPSSHISALTSELKEQGNGDLAARLESGVFTAKPPGRRRNKLMSDIYKATYDAVRESFDPGNLQQIIIQDFCAVADEMRRPCVLFRPTVYRDGNKWCALYGVDLMEGVAGFGNSPAEAMADFDKNWHKSIEPVSGGKEGAAP